MSNRVLVILAAVVIAALFLGLYWVSPSHSADGWTPPPRPWYEKRPCPKTEDPSNCAYNAPLQGGGLSYITRNYPLLRADGTPTGKLVHCVTYSRKAGDRRYRSCTIR